MNVPQKQGRRESGAGEVHAGPQGGGGEYISESSRGNTDRSFYILQEQSTPCVISLKGLTK